MKAAGARGGPKVEKGGGEGGGGFKENYWQEKVVEICATLPQIKNLNPPSWPETNFGCIYHANEYS